MQRVLYSQKLLCCGENKGHSPTDQATRDSRGGTCPRLLTCGFNYQLVFGLLSSQFNKLDYDL